MNPNQAPQRRRRKAKGNANAKNRSQDTGARQARARKPRRGPAAAQTGGAKSGPMRSAAAAYAAGQNSGQAQIYRDSPDTCRIVHRELISSVSGTVAFTVANSFALNPGMAASFPWLSNEAQGWEKYRFNKLRFCYYTRTGTGVPGSVMLAPDFDATDAAPVSEVVASSYQDTVEDAPWKDICCDLQPRQLMGDMRERFLRFGALAANQDIKTYDCGNLHLCTVDGTAVSWGKLWVEYDVTLFTPQVPAGGFQSTGTLQAAGGTLAAGTPWGAAPLATGTIVLSNSGADAVVAISNVQIGQEISFSARMTGTVISVFGSATYVGLTKVVGTNVFNAAATDAAELSTFTVTALPCSLRLAVTATTVTATDCVVSVLAPKPAF